jgi:hypothetical protein
MPPRLSLGIARVTGGIGLWSAPSEESENFAGVPHWGREFESEVQILQGPVCSEGFYWYQVNYNDVVGWAIESIGEYYLLVQVSVEPTTVLATPQVEGSLINRYPFGETVEFSGANCPIADQNSTEDSGFTIFGITIDLVGTIYAADVPLSQQCVAFVREESHGGRRPDEEIWAYPPLDAKSWDNRARDEGLEVISGPSLDQVRRNDILVWEPGCNGVNPSVGHVGIVSNVDPNVGLLYYDDRNADNRGSIQVGATMSESQLGQACMSIIHSPSQQWWQNQDVRFGRNCGLDPERNMIVNCRALAVVRNGNSYTAYFEVPTDGVENRPFDIRVDNGNPGPSLNAQFCGSTNSAVGFIASQDLTLLQICFVALSNETSIGGLDLSQKENWLFAYFIVS